MENWKLESTVAESHATLLPMCWFGSINETVIPMKALINCDQQLQITADSDDLCVIGKDLMPHMQHIDVCDVEEPELQCTKKIDTLLYFKVPDIKLEDLFDWSERLNKSAHEGLIKSSPKVFRRQKSKTGSVAHVNEESIALFRFKDSVFAIFEKCPHAGGPLHLGDIEALPETGNICIKCPWHSWKFDLNSGKVVYPKSREVKARTYKTIVDTNGDIWIGFDKFNTDYFNPKKISF